MAWKMGVTNPATRIQFWWTFADGLLRNPRGLRYTGAMVALYLHLGPFARFIANKLTVEIDQSARRAS
jgi:hypothetical protein